MHTFSVGSTILSAWGTFKKRPWLFVGALVVVGIATMIGNLAASAFGDQGVSSAGGSLINFLVSMLLGMGETAFFLKAYDDEKAAQIQDLWHPRPFWKYVGAAVLVGLCVLVVAAAVLILVMLINLALGAQAATFNAVTIVGLVVIVACIFAVSVRLQFAQYAVIDRGLWPLQALKESFRMTKGHFWTLVGLLLTLIAINILGAILLFVGLLVSVPVTMLSIVHAYRTLGHRA